MDYNAPGELVEFQIVPRETIQAVSGVIEAFLRNSLSTQSETNYAKRLLAGLKNALKDDGKTWPLSVAVGSKISGKLHEFVQFARKHIRHDGSFHCYLTSFPTFYDDTAEVDAEGLLVSPQVIIFADIDYPPPNWYARDNFEALRSAALFKAQVYPPAHERTEEWRDGVEQLLSSPPKVPGVAAFRPWNYKGSKVRVFGPPVNPNGPDGAKDDFIRGSEPSTETRASSPTPTNQASNEEAENTTKSQELEVVYTATLRTGTETITIDLDPAKYTGAEKELVSKAKEILAWTTAQGCTDVRLEAVVDLAKKMVAKNDEADSSSV